MTVAGAGWMRVMGNDGGRGRMDGGDGMIGVGFTIWGSVAWQRKGEACGAERASAHRFREHQHIGFGSVAWQRRGESCGAERASAHRFRECSMVKEGGSLWRGLS